MRDGACVVDNGELGRVVTAMDLDYQKKQIHLPSFIMLVELVIPLGSSRAQAELELLTSSTVTEFMSENPVTVEWGAPLDEVASLMSSRHFTIVPVLKAASLQDVITKRVLLWAAFAARTLV